MMTNTAYQRGAKFERRVAKWYETQGMDVVRSAGSHGLSDVTALLGGKIIFNSLRLKNYWSPVEREEFEALVKRHTGSIGRYVWRDKAKRIQFKEV